MGTKERLAIGTKLLEDIERNRERTQRSGLGASIEKRIIERELGELEQDILADPGALECLLVRVRPRRRNR